MAQNLDHANAIMFDQYRDFPTVRLRNRIVAANVGLVGRIAAEHSKMSGQPYEDLAQEGSIGLIKAVERYQPDRGSAFCTFAFPFIRGAILHYLRDKVEIVRVPRRLKELLYKAKKFTATYILENGFAPKDPLIAEFLEITLEKYLDLKVVEKNSWILSLDFEREGKDSPIEFSTAVEDPKVPTEPEDFFFDAALAKLPKLHQEILIAVCIEEKLEKDYSQDIKKSLEVVLAQKNKALRSLWAVLAKDQKEKPSF